MSRIRTAIIVSLGASALLTAFSGCRGQLQQQQGLSDAQVRQLATKYRDEWLSKNPIEDNTILMRGSVQVVERQATGWHVVFVAETGHSPSTPEGIHDYYLHVFLTPSGELEKVKRGPDVLS